ncbi:MAG: hypothetical protein JO218_10575 [Burkholderiales bacterium]|nr:hypothetical protein [Burkholderiales bacterium]
MSTSAKIFIAASLIGGVLAAGHMGSNGFGSTTSSSDDTNAKLKEVVANINKQTPVVKGNLRFDGVEAGDMEIRFNYTVLVSTIAEQDKPKLKEMVRPRMIEEYCNNPQLGGIHKHGVKAAFNFYDTEHIAIVAIEIPPTECRG